jgi:two-component system sensor histidine kinase BaeS
MKLTIQRKYTIALLGLTLLVLIATLGLARWSFERGFLDYVNTIEQQRLQRVQPVIANEYVRSGGNWDSMTPYRFDRLLHDARPEGSRDGPGPQGRPPPHRAGATRGGPPPRGAPPPPAGKLSLPLTTIYDVNNELVVGKDLGFAQDKLNRVSIDVDGVSVGELRSAPRQQLVSPEETAFSAQQLTASWMIGIVAMVLALGVSVLLARGMLSPLHRMLDDVNQLSNGDYSVRVAGDRPDELGDLMRNLNRLAETLEKNRDSRQQWFADISHELRTPVTVLTGELEALQDGIRDFDRKQVDSLMQEVQRLRYLIDDLYELSVSDIGGLRYEYATISLDESLRSVVESVRTRAIEAGIEISLETVPLYINGDRQRLDQLLQNLLANSLAYTDPPGRIAVGLSRLGDLAVVVIEDSPPGASHSDCAQLFEPLYRREASRSRRTGGAGLGLAICRKIVEAHGGEISAAPAALGGLCIRIELPLVENGEA